MMLMPTAMPARIRRTHIFQPPLSLAKPIARKHMPMPMSCAATPQQAVEKKCELKAVATAPKTHASGDSLHWRKQNQAQMPRMKMERGQKIFEYPSGDVISRNAVDIAGEGVGCWSPIQFKSRQ